MGRCPQERTFARWPGVSNAPCVCGCDSPQTGLCGSKRVSAEVTQLGEAWMQVGVTPKSAFVVTRGLQGLPVREKAWSASAPPASQGLLAEPWVEGGSLLWWHSWPEGDSADETSWEEQPQTEPRGCVSLCEEYAGLQQPDCGPAVPWSMWPRFQWLQVSELCPGPPQLGTAYLLPSRTLEEQVHLPSWLHKETSLCQVREKVS